MKKIAVGDIGEFWYGDYKEPFEQLEGGVPGHPVGVVLKADDGKLLCAYCGKTYENLASHVAKTHRMPAREYKAEVGLQQQSALVSERLRWTRTATALRIGLGSAGSGAKRGQKGHPPAKVGSWSPERANRTGRCYSQLLAVAADIQRQDGRITTRSLANRGIWQHVWHRYFDSIEEFADAAHATPGHRRNKPLSDERLLSAIRDLGAKLGRTPATSDINRFGLPTTKVFARRWGSYRNACKAAGLTPNLISPGQPQPVEEAIRILVAYANTGGNSEKAAEALGLASSTVQRTLRRYGFPFSFGRPTDAIRRQKVEWAADMARRLAGVEAAA